MIEIIQTPGEINGAYGINAVTLSGITEPNRRYKLEIWNGDNTAQIASKVITPNQYGNGLVDIKNVLQTLISPSVFNVETITTVTDAFYETKPYIIKAVEVDLVDNLIGTYSVSDVRLVIGARKDAWDVNLTLPIGALTDNYMVKGVTLNPKPVGLLNTTLVKYVKLTRKDYHTISYRNNFENYVIYPYIDGVAQTPITVTNSLTDDYPSVFVTLPVGFKNIQYVLPLGTDLYYVNVNNDWWCFEIIEEDCNFETIQLSWLNSWGFRDYYTFTKRVDKTTNVIRNSYNRSIIDYNFVGIQTEKGKAGEVIYNQKIEKEYIIRTDYITDGESEYFENLIISPSVRARFGNNWYDVVPLTNSWRLQRFITDRMFQLEYRFKLASNINSARG